MSRHTLAGIALLSLLLLGFTNSEEFTAGPQTAAKFESAFTGIETFLDAIDDCTAGQAVGGAGADTVPSACLTLAGLDRQAADCSAETGGTSGELCLQTADDTLWACPASAAPCDGAGWLQIAGGAGGSTFSVDGTLVADPDLRSDGDQQAVLCVGAGNPDPACVAAGDVLLRHQPASVALADMADAPAAGILSGPSGSGGTPVYQVPGDDNQIPVSFLGGSAWLWSKVSNDTLDFMSQSRIKGRPAGAGIGRPQDLTPVQVADVLGSEVVKPDGSVAMTGALDMGGNAPLGTALPDGQVWRSTAGAMSGHLVGDTLTGTFLDPNGNVACVHEQLDVYLSDADGVPGSGEDEALWRCQKAGDVATSVWMPETTETIRRFFISGNGTAGDCLNLENPWLWDGNLTASCSTTLVRWFFPRRVLVTSVTITAQSSWTGPQGCTIQLFEDNGTTVFAELDFPDTDERKSSSESATLPLEFDSQAVNALNGFRIGVVDGAHCEDGTGCVCPTNSKAFLDFEAVVLQ